MNGDRSEKSISIAYFPLDICLTCKLNYGKSSGILYYTEVQTVQLQQATQGVFWPRLRAILQTATVDYLSPSHPIKQIKIMFRKLKGGFLLVIGYLLSPLCWWNDLVFNLPIAYFVGYIFSLFNSDLLVPCSIAAYWLSNVTGIIMMQVGAVDVLQGQPKERNLKKELLTGLVSSTVYTMAILALIQFKILENPGLFPVKIL